MSVSLPTVEDFKNLQDEVRELKTIISVLCDRINAPKVVTVADICKAEGVSKAQIHTKEIYLLPNFGVSEFPDGVKRWNVSTYLRWRTIPVRQRKDMYVEYLENLRKAGRRGV